MTTTRQIEMEDADGGFGLAVQDSLTLVRRNLTSLRRQPQLLVFTAIQPIIFILLFRFVFGGAIQAPGDIDYVNYLLTGIFVQTTTFSAIQTGIGLADDLNKGIVDRFKSIPMSRGAVLAGRVGADAVRNVFVVAIMVAVGYAVGFRFTNGVLGAALALLLILVFGSVFSTFGAFLGLRFKNPETVQAAAFPMIFPLVFASSIFVPVQTLPGWLQAFVKVNPLTLVTDTVRGLALGQPFEVWPNLGWTLLWMAVIVALFGTISVRLYRKA